MPSYHPLRRCERGALSWRVVALLWLRLALLWLGVTLLWQPPPSAAAQEQAAPPADAETPADAWATADLSSLVDDAVERLHRKAQEEGLNALHDRDYPAALSAFERAQELVPKDISSLRHLGHLHTLLGNRGEAAQYYRRTLALDPQDAEGYLALAALLAEGQDNSTQLQEANQLLQRARQLGGPPQRIAIQRARVASALGQFDVAAQEYAAALQVTAADGELLLEVGDFYRDIGETEEAIAWYRQVESPRDLVEQAAQRIFELDVRRQARHDTGLSGPPVDPATLDAQLTRARVAASQGELEQAEKMLREAIRQAPTSAAPRAQLGELLHAQGGAQALSEAERLLLQAVALEGEPNAQRGLALLYVDLGPEYRQEAAFFLRRALRLRPDYWRLHLQAAEVERSLGRLPEALRHVQRFIDQAGPGPAWDQAQTLYAELAAALQASPSVAKSSVTRAGPLGNSGTLGALHRAQAHLGRGEASAALTELARLPRSAQDEQIWNLRATILQATGRHAEAATALEHSLQHLGNQPEVRLRLADIHLQLGHAGRARSQLVRAEEAGAIEATLRLAEQDASGGGEGRALSFLWDSPRVLRLLAAYDRLQHYLDVGQGQHGAEARALLHSLRQRLVGVLGALGVALLGVLGLCVYGYQVRMGGIDLPTLMRGHPEATGDVLRVLSAVRHEVLKHNTLMLASVAGRLQQGQNPGAQGQHLCRALLGHTQEEGAAARLQHYASELVQIARSHGEQLNLRHRDTTMGPLLEAMQRLVRQARSIGRAQNLSRSQRQRLGDRLQRLHRQINEQGYTALQRLLATTRSYEVTETALCRVADRVQAEPALAGRSIPPLSIEAEPDALPCPLDVPRAAFDDVLTNLLRNALQAALAMDDQAAARVALRVQREEDPITGLSRALFWVCDSAPEPLSDDLLRGGYIERGLGLTADLVARYNGSLSVAQHVPGFEKAVILAFPLRAEDP